MPGVPVSLQWGRRLATAEWRRLHRTGSRARSASMGPPSCDGGVQVEVDAPCFYLGMLQWGRRLATAECAHCRADREARQRGASMGPPSCDGGVSPRGVSGSTRNVYASMGPPSCDGGVFWQAFASLWVLRMLQWGRRLATAEWSPRTRSRRGPTDASMGPPSCDGGVEHDPHALQPHAARFNGAAVLRRRSGVGRFRRHAPWDCGLQWGRRLATAECVEDERPTVPERPASMGPPSCDGGVRLTVLSTRQRPGGGFNGAAVLRRRSAGIEVLAHSIVQERFNGAAVLRRRSVYGALPDGSRYVWLQWGRRLATAEW